MADRSGFQFFVAPLGDGTLLDCYLSHRNFAHLWLLAATQCCAAGAMGTVGWCMSNHIQHAVAGTIYWDLAAREDLMKGINL